MSSLEEAGRCIQLARTCAVRPEARGYWDASPSGFSKAMRRIRSALETEPGHEAAHWTLRDPRRTMATGLQRLGVGKQPFGSRSLAQLASFRRGLKNALTVPDSESDFRQNHERNPH